MGFIKFVIMFSTFFFNHSLIKADNFSDAAILETQNIIENQIQAFISEDSERAFSYAAPMIKLRFNNADEFMSMVKSYYEPVYNPKQYYFINSKYLENSIYHQLQVVSQSNVSYLATYSLIKENEKWKISGCAVYPMQQQSI